MPSMPPPPPPTKPRTARVAAQLDATTAITQDQVAEARSKRFHATETTSTQGATSSMPRPFPIHAVGFDRTADDIPVNPSMPELTQFVRGVVFSQNYLHSEVKRLSEVCASNQTTLLKQQALLEAQAVTIAELQGERVDKSGKHPTVVITDQGEGCKQDLL